MTSRTHAQQAAEELIEMEPTDNMQAAVAEVIARHIAAALAEQAALIYRAIKELEYIQQAEDWTQYATSEGAEIITEGMKLLGVKDLSAGALPAPPAKGETK